LDLWKFKHCKNWLAAAGTQTAGLGFGGHISRCTTGATEEYDGSTWSPSGSLNTARLYLAGCGTQTAALAFGGYMALQLLQEQQKNTMVQLGLLVILWFKTGRLDLAGCWNSNCSFSFW
jgi:hypothetical protein